MAPTSAYGAGPGRDQRRLKKAADLARSHGRWSSRFEIDILCSGTRDTAIMRAGLRRLRDRSSDLERDG